MATALWIGVAALVVVLVAWRLRRANQHLSDILREERERPVIDESDEPRPDVRTSPNGARHGRSR